MDIEGFIYLNIDHPVVAWNTYRGVLMPPSSMKLQEGERVLSMRIAGMLGENDVCRLKSELQIEALRAAEFPNTVSRLQGLFVFDEVESTLAAESAEWGGHITSNYLTDVGVASERSTRVDANWITQAMDTGARLQPGWEELIREYWSGRPYLEMEPIWERLVDGRTAVWGTELRKRAYDVVKRHFPHSLGLAEFGRLAAQVGSTCGNMAPLLLDRGDRYEVSFGLDDRERSTERLQQAIGAYIAANPKKVDIVNLKELVFGVTRAPDLTRYTIVLPNARNT